MGFVDQDEKCQGKMRKMERFEFGKNWSKFLSILGEDRIVEAEKSLKDMLETKVFENKRFLDIGSGSGLFSLAARRLGANVHSFDFDPLSVACTLELKRRYFWNDSNWAIEQGDVLDRDYLNSLGQFDVVYSWGVLHHTGAMWQALENVVPLVAKGGKLFVSIYNDQGRKTRYWTVIKRFYNRSSKLTKLIMTLIFLGYFGIPKVLFRLKKERGMSFFHDVVDWIGGYPFEVAKPEQIFDFYRDKGFLLMRLKTRTGLGCNEFLFSRSSERNQKRIGIVESDSESQGQ
jgi:2-polyprenyl-6-hydroxyphenyl methylase/3-demethylubiquinone-9 3-methyltransferase